MGIFNFFYLLWFITSPSFSCRVCRSFDNLCHLKHRTDYAATDTAREERSRMYPGGKSGLTDMVGYKRFLYMVGFLRPPSTISGWTTFPSGYCNSEIQDDVQDGRHILKYPYYHRLLLYFHMQYIVSMLFSKRTTLRSLYAIGRPSVCLSVCCLLSVCL